MSLFDLIRQNAIAATMGGFALGAGVIYLVLRPPMVSDTFPPFFQITDQGRGESFFCDLTINEDKVCANHQPGVVYRYRIKLGLHPGNNNLAQIQAYRTNQVVTGITWDALLKGVSIDGVNIIGAPAARPKAAATANVAPSIPDRFYLIDVERNARFECDLRQSYKCQNYTLDKLPEHKRLVLFMRSQDDRSMATIGGLYVRGVKTVTWPEMRQGLVLQTVEGPMTIRAEKIN